MVGIEHILTLQDGTKVDSNVAGKTLIFDVKIREVQQWRPRALAALLAGRTRHRPSSLAAVWARGAVLAAPLCRSMQPHASHET